MCMILITELPQLVGRLGTVNRFNRTGCMAVVTSLTDRTYWSAIVVSSKFFDGVLVLSIVIMNFVLVKGLLSYD